MNASKYGKFLVTYTPGDSFGELALIHDAPRGATILTRQDTWLIEIKREDYQRHVRKLEVGTPHCGTPHMMQVLHRRYVLFACLNCSPVSTTVCPSQLFACLNCLPVSTVCLSQLFALNS